MAAPPFPHNHPVVTLLPFILLPLLAAANLVLEDGYAVTTVADLDHLPASSGPGIHPYALVPRPRAGDLVLLDSTGSALYVLPLSTGGGGAEPRRLAGGVRGAGCSDGGPGEAAFNRPRGVAVDAADNVYVADRINGTIRKVAPSGFTTTIAGGLSSGNGHRNGPAQNATFSPDFELVYVPSICALLVTDRGNRMIRRVNLKPEDCAHEERSGLGASSVSVIAVFSALLGLVIGFLARHLYPFHELSINRFFSRIQKKYKRTQRTVTLISFCDIRSAIANSMVYAFLLKLVRVSLGYITVMLPSVRLERRVPCKPSCLVNLDNTGSGPSTGLHNKARAPTELLGDLMCFGGGTGEEDNGMTYGSSVSSQKNEVSSFDGDLMELLYTPQDSHKKIDHMIEANLSDFSVGSYNGSRRLHGDIKVL